MAHLGVACRRLDLGGLGERGWSGMFVAGLAFRGRLQQVRKASLEKSQVLTVQRGIHAPNVDQQTDHGHVDSSRALCQQLVL